MSAETVSTKEHQKILMTLLREFDRVCKARNIPYILFAGSLLGAVRHQGFIPWDDDLDVLMLREDYERFLLEAESVLDLKTFYLQKEFSEHWPMYFSKLRLNNTACLEKYHPKDPHIHQGIYMDIFPCDNAAPKPLGRKLQFFASKVVIAKSLYTRGYDTNSKSKKVFMAFCRFLPLKPFLKISQARGKETDMVQVFLGGASSFQKSVFPKICFREQQPSAFEDGHYPIPEGYDTILKTLYGNYMELPPAEDRAVKKHAILVDPYNSYEKYRDYRDGMKFDIHTRSIR